MRQAIPKLILIAALFTAVVSAQKVPAPDSTEPNPKLTPGQVIAIQIKALRNNGKMPDDGESPSRSTSRRLPIEG